MIATKHYHVMVLEWPGKHRRGALTTTETAAQSEAEIELAVDPTRAAGVVTCEDACFGSQAR